MKKIIPLTLLLIALDQLSKYLVFQSQANFNLISNLFQIEYSQNFGIIFGFPIPKILTILLAIILIPSLTYFFRKDLNWNKNLTQTIYTLILSGALGNLLDRFTYGFVVDFIAIGPWPNFNLADSYITIGVISTLVLYPKLKA